MGTAMFDDGNGGEYRKSLHVYGPPFAQLVDSPTKINGAGAAIISPAHAHSFI
eukprot:COSAG02_NODE_2257_length_9341_cov_13.355118_9_plen_53_part_00